MAFRWLYIQDYQIDSLSDSFHSPMEDSRGVRKQDNPTGR